MVVEAVMLLVGDIRLSDTNDPQEPFSLLDDVLRTDDVIFGNLEGALYDEIDAYEYYNKTRWRHPGTRGAGALKAANFAAVGLANNVIIGADAIRSTIRILDDMGIAHTGAGADLQAACAPAIVESGGVRYGFLQRTSIHWPTHHRAVPSGPVTIPHDVDLRYRHGMVVPGDTITFVGAPGVATIKARTAYEPSYSSMYEAGGDAIIHTWPDATELSEFVDDVKQLRSKVDVLVTSHHWRLTGKDIARDYRMEIAHAAIDAGADLVVGHGTHTMEEIEVYKGKAILYGLGELLFRWGDMWVPGYAGHRHPSELKRHHLIAQADVERGVIRRVSCRFVRRHSVADDRPVLRRVADEREGLEHLEAISNKFGTSLRVVDDRIIALDAANETAAPTGTVSRAR